MINQLISGMTDIERAVAEWLNRNNIDYTPQVGMLGGRIGKGGAVVDFELYYLSIILRIMGQYWHKGLVANARDKVQRELLTNQGYTVVDILESNLSPEKIEHTMRLAILGQEIF